MRANKITLTTMVIVRIISVPPAATQVLLGLVNRTIPHSGGRAKRCSEIPAARRLDCIAARQAPGRPAARRLNPAPSHHCRQRPAMAALEESCRRHTQRNAHLSNLHFRALEASGRFLTLGVAGNISNRRCLVLLRDAD
jgi:hypothetical protein